MPLSDVNICNMALGHLGDAAQITAIAPPDGSAQAAYCSRFYAHARDEALELIAPQFAVKRNAPAALATNDLESIWGYAYPMPNKCLRVLQVLTPEATDLDRGQPFLIEGGVIYTNVASAVVRYVEQVDDTTKFTPHFVSALSRLIAHYVAGPLIKGETGVDVAKDQYKIYRAAVNEAAALDRQAGLAPASQSYTDFTPGALAARA